MEKFETRLVHIDSKDYKSMLLNPDEIQLLSKRVADVPAFFEAYEKKSLLVTKASMKPEEVKSFVMEKGEQSLNVNYRKTLALGMPGSLDFSDPADVEPFLNYVEKQWFFSRSDKTLSPFKAMIPYLLGLLLTLFCTGAIVYYNTVGGEIRANVIFILLLKLSEKIGLVGTILLALVIVVLIIRAMLKAYKNPPIETRLEAR